MTQTKNAFWRCLYTPGHDAALVVPLADGWLLKGTAVFGVPEGITAVTYEVEADAGWVAKRGTVLGFRGDTQFYHAIERTPDGWVLDGRPQGLAGLQDLDFGFTPATNFQQLGRAKLKVGERAEFSVAWFDIGKHQLLALPQIYERRDETHYWYQSPQGGYEAILEMAETGFVRVYPELWQMEDAPLSAG